MSTFKSYGGVKYIADKDFDYTNAIAEAEKYGDYDYAAFLEKCRNAKIDGEGLSYAKTYKYQNGSADKYKNNYSSEINSALKDIKNRKPFEYDYTKDESYKALEKVYTENGKLAMQDTLGDAAALTGGRASTAAISASQQAYNRYMSELAANIPALEQAAYGRYKDEEQSLYNKLSLINSLEEKEYGRFLDDRNWKYTLDRDRVKDEQWQAGMDLETDKFDYTKNQDAIDRNISIGNATGDFSGLLEYGYTQDVVDALNKAHADGVSKEEMQEAFEKAKLMAQCGDFSGFKDAGFTDEQIKTMEDYYNDGTLKEDALFAAQFGDYSKIEALGIKPKVVTSGDGDKGDDAEDKVFSEWAYRIDLGQVTYDSILGDPAFLDALEGNGALAKRIQDYAKEVRDKGYDEQKNNKYETYAARIYSGESIDSLGSAEGITKEIGLENYEKLREIAEQMNGDGSW